MTLTADALKDMLGTIAIMALLAVAFGTVMRRTERRAAAQGILGALFGGAAILAILDPLQLAPGVIVDLRGVPVALAGAFLGWPGAAATVVMAVLMRVHMGGIGTVPGVVGIAMASLAGLGWAFLHRRRPEHERRGVATLAAASSLYVLSIFLLPWDLAWPAFASAGPFLVPLHFLGVLAVGGLLERERRIVSEGKLLERAAARDPLTGLLNRRGFEAAVARAPRGRRGAALLLLDLDRFKGINDRHGHAGGDAVLGALGPRLRAALRPGDVVARFGGEEVAVFLPTLGPQEARSIAERLCQAVRAEPFALPGGRRLRVTASVGGAWTDGPVGLEVLTWRADAALYAAKADGRDRCRFDAEPHAPATATSGPTARADAA